MSNYIVSARKYRPNTFEDVVGQKALTQTLCNAIKSDKLAHAYLFCGPRGVGKTTCARIFAKTINCEHRSPSGEACNQCESCRAFDEGRSLNIHELDAASNNSVENIRDIIEQVRIPPQIGKYKVFIIDEVHMLSPGAFNAFLKTLEEPPSYVIFILATTEKQKIIPTILSRCQIYDFKRIEVDDIVGQLKKISACEGITYEEDALRVIAEKSDGGMRDALSVFDQQVIFTEGNLTYQQVISNLNILDYDYLFAVTDLFLKCDISKLLLTLDEIIGKGFDGGAFVGELANHMRNLLVSSDTATIPLLKTSNQIKERYKEQASRCKTKFIYKTLKLCRECELNYRVSRNKRLLTEITLIEIAQAAKECNDDTSEDPFPAAGEKEQSKTLKGIFKETQKAEIRTSDSKSSAVSPVTASEAVKKQSKDLVQESKVALVQDTPATYNNQTAEKGVSGNTNATLPKSEKKANVINVVSIRGLQARGKEKETSPNNTKPRNPDIQQNKSVNVIGLDLYDENKFSVAWLKFADSLPIEESDIAGRMKAIKPELFPDGTVNVKVENHQVEKFMQPMVPRLESFLRSELNNRNVKIRICVSEDIESIPVMNTTEQFKKMITENPYLSKINDTFQLELA